MRDQQILEQAIAMISQLMGQMEAEAFRKQGFSELSMRQLLYLETIARLERPTFGELAAELGVTRPSVSGISQKLMQMGYIKKVQSADDRRVYRILLTAKGERLDELHQEIHRLLAERLTQNLNETEVEQMAALLGKVVAG